MEQLEIHEGNGQSYGYLVYRKSLPLTSGRECWSTLSFSMPCHEVQTFFRKDF
jgi:hypothetical protein